MVSLYGILDVGARGVNVAQAGLNTTGHNISNANTEGYSRQRNIQRALDPILTTSGAWDQGVEVALIERLRDNFLEKQIRTSVSENTYYTEMENYFSHLESILSDPLNPISDTEDLTKTGGLSNLIANFFHSMNEVSNSPESMDVRTTAVESGKILADTLNAIEGQLNSFMEDMNNRVKVQIGQVDNLAQKMIAINEKVAMTEGNPGIEANDFRDERDRILKQLSEIIPISTEENASGIINVSVAGQWLVDNLSVNPLVTEISKQFEEINIYSVRLGKNGLYQLDPFIRKGELGAAFDMRDRIIPDILQSITDLTRSIINEVNKIHCPSSGLEGYSSVQSSFYYPHNADSPDTKLTLDRVFNNPINTADPIFGKNPFPVQNGQFQIRVTDKDSNIKDTYKVNIKTTDTLYDVVDKINRSDGIVQSVNSALKFDPVFVSRATATKGEKAAEAGFTLGALSVAAGTPISEAPPTPPNPATTYTFEIQVKDAYGNLVDANPATAAYDPFTITFDNTDTLTTLMNKIQAAGAPTNFRSSLAPVSNGSTELALQVQPVPDGWTLSFQNDTSGLIKAFGFPMTDPTVPLIGGTTASTVSSFSNPTFYTGVGSPQFSPAFPGPPPSVITAGTFDFVVIDNANNPTIHTVTIDNAVAGDINTFAELQTALQAFDPNITVTITPDNKFEIQSSNNRQFFFQNDSTGLIKAMGLSEISGFGSINGQPFKDGSFEMVVANDQGTVTHIVEVPIKADPSVPGGVPTLNGIISAINAAIGNSGAPLFASIITDPADSTKNTIKVEAGTGYEFTFRSDDSLLLSALGFTAGPVLDPTGDAPILAAENPIAIGDNIGGMVKAKITTDVGFDISTIGTDKLSFVGGDTSNFLAATGVNSFFSGYNARTIQVNKYIDDNPALLAVSSDGTKGNNDTALKLASLEDSDIIDGQSLSGFYRNMISTLGVEGNRNSQLLKTNDTIKRELEARQEQNSGVSIDEESINIIKYQQAYQASAKIISTVDQLLNLVINQMGKG